MITRLNYMPEITNLDRGGGPVPRRGIQKRLAVGVSLTTARGTDPIDASLKPDIVRQAV
jgi:hypothetical protein